MKNELTYAQLDYECMKAAGITRNDIEDGYRYMYINSNQGKIYGMLDGLNDPWYDKSTILTVASTDQAYITSASNITSMVVSGSTITIVVSSFAFVAGQMLDIVLVSTTGGTILNQCKAIVTTGGTTATATIISGTMITKSGSHTLAMNVLSSFSATSADVSGIYFKNFIKIGDNNYTGTPGIAVNRLFDEVEDIMKFGNYVTDPIATNIKWHQRGDTIEFIIPPSVTNALGTVTGWYRGKPAICSPATLNNTIDMPWENNRMLIDEVIASYLLDRNKPVPADVAARNQAYSAKYQEATASKLKAIEIKNK
jgi:hypothetical protein